VNLTIPMNFPLNQMKLLLRVSETGRGDFQFKNQIFISVQYTNEKGWLKGTINGRSGLFPENYAVPYSKYSYRAITLYPCRASNPRELSFDKNQVIENGECYVGF
jgi:hypothetical protein